MSLPKRSHRPPSTAAARLTRARSEAERATAEARRAHQRLCEAIDLLPEGIVFLDPEHRYIHWNREYESIYRGSADLFEVGRKFEDTLRVGVARGQYPEALGREEAWFADRLAYLNDPGRPHEQHLADGRTILIEERRTADGGIIGLRVDITEMKRREASFRLLFEDNPVPMFLFAVADQRLLAANEAAIVHYGHARHELLGRSLADIHDPAEHGDLAGILGETADWQSGRTWRHRKADGSLIDVAIFSRRMTYAGVDAALIAAVDITARKQAETRIAYMAQHDELTGLSNRAHLRRQIDEMLACIGRNNQRLAVLWLDLDNFKTVNDTLGHRAGDLLLQKVAQRLRGCLREGDALARLGSDEFVMVQAGVAGPDDAGALAARLVGALGDPFDLDGHLVSIGVSIGVALAPGDGADAERLLKNADLAQCRAKEDGRGTYRYFEKEMDAKMQARRRLEIDLRRAMQEDVLELHYQPLVNLGTGRIIVMEALLRWPDAARGHVPPAEFIPVAEETGLIVPLGAHVLQRACADAAAWPCDVKVAVNLSPLQFRAGNLLQVVLDALAASGLAASRLELEITEALLLDRSDCVLDTLHALRALGVRISMDDFGTGYSSLSYLNSFPFDKIKIDRSFVHGLEKSADSQAIVRAIVSLGLSLGIAITAEGVETEAALACLRREGCTEGQGFLFSAARPQAEVLGMLRREAARHAALAHPPPGR